MKNLSLIVWRDINITVSLLRVNCAPKQYGYDKEEQKPNKTNQFFYEYRSTSVHVNNYLAPSHEP